jgi:hypothetical protein
VTNRNKAAGDRFEREQRDFYRANGFPGAEKTRAGYERDGGDVHLDPVVGMTPGVISQCKRVASPRWTEWVAGLKEQIANSHAEVGFLVWKRPKIGDPGEQLAVMPVRDLLHLLRRAGYGTPLDEQDKAA